MKTVLLPDGEKASALGQGTWMMGERRDRRAAEIAASRTGVERSATNRDAVSLPGNGHGRVKPMPRRFDVGVDARGFRPVPLDGLLCPMASPAPGVATA